MSGKKRSAGKIILRIFIVILAIAILYAAGCLIIGRIKYADFNSISERVVGIPDRLKGMTPQGVSAIGDTTVVCGYMKGSAASRIYVFGKDVKYVELEKENGEVYDGHAGGMTVNGDYVYISNAAKIFVLKTSDLLNAADGGKVRFIGRFEVPCRSSFCSSDGEYLNVGEFHANGYDTDESHLVKCADGDYQALIFAYKLSETAEFGAETTPCAAYAVRDIVQGAAFSNGIAVLSCSWGLSSSDIVIYNASGIADGELSLNGTAMPLYVFDSKRELASVKAPHMSEDVEFSGGKLLVAFEGGTLKYGAGLLPFSLHKVMRVDVMKLIDAAEA